MSLKLCRGDRPYSALTPSAVVAQLSTGQNPPHTPAWHPSSSVLSRESDPWGRHDPIRAFHHAYMHVDLTLYIIVDISSAATAYSYSTLDA
jgi:hypothetical protein